VPVAWATGIAALATASIDGTLAQVAISMPVSNLAVLVDSRARMVVM
jgi:hypothetical protein